MTAAQERHRQQIRTQEQPSMPIHVAEAASSGSSLQLVGGVPPIPEGQDGAVEQETPRVSMERLCRGPTKARLAPGGAGGTPPSSPEHPGGADSVGIEDTSEQRGDWHQ